MNYQKQYELLIDEIEALLTHIGPSNDSLIDIIPPLYDEIQEVMPDKLFVDTAPLLRECRGLVSRYKLEGFEEAPLVLSSLCSSTSKLKRMINDYVSAVDYGSSFDGTVNKRE